MYDTNTAKVIAEVLDLVVIVTAGAKQHPGQSRLDLAAANVAMAQTLTPQLLEHSPQAVIVFVTNPVDVVTYAASTAVGVRPGQIFGTGTVLDSSRFRYLVAQRAAIAVGNVHGIVIGEHGDSEIPLWATLSIGGVRADAFESDGRPVFDEPTRTAIAAGVVNAAYEIIVGKGATNLAIGLATARIVEAILGDQHRVLAVSTVQTGAYGITGVALSLPTVVSAGGAGRVLEVELSAEELRGLRESAQTLEDVQRSLGI